jgi:hypothetical protein
MIHLEDWRGTLIKIGSLIIYSVRSGSSMKQVEATVKEITTCRQYGDEHTCLMVQPVRSSCHWDTNFSKPRRLTAFENITVLS